jgi:O-antigen/teichoic acid export membrane protein
MVAFAVAHLTRGTLSSHGRFNDYAIFFGVDGLTRPAVAVVLGLAGVATAGPFGAALALAPFVGAAAALRRPKGLLEPGPPAPWAELSTALGWLLLGTGSMAMLLNGGTVAVDLLASPSQQDAAGVFLNGLVVSRIPLFLFQAVLASLLPNLAHLASSNHWAAFRSALFRLLVAVAAFGVVAVVGAAVLGPPVIERVFGSTQVLSASDLALLTASSVVMMAAATLSQAMIAMEGHARMAVGWLLAFITFVVVTLVAGPDLFFRVEIGLLAGSTVGLLWCSVAVGFDVRARRRAHEVALPEELADLMLQP